MIGFRWICTAYFTWLANHKTAFNCQHHHLSSGVLHSSFRRLQQLLSGISGLNPSALQVSRIFPPRLVGSQITCDTHMVVSALSGYFIKLRQVFYLPTRTACSERKMALSLVNRFRFLPMKPIADLAQLLISTLFAVMIFSVFQARNFAEQIWMLPQRTRIAEQLAFVVGSRPASVPILLGVLIGHAF